MPRKFLALTLIGWMFMTFQQGKLTLVGSFVSKEVCEYQRGAFSGYQDSINSPVWSGSCFAN